MKSNIKRIFCILIVLLMVFSVAACGKAQDDGSTLEFDDEAWEIEVDGETQTDNETEPEDTNDAGDVSSEDDSDDVAEPDNNDKNESKNEEPKNEDKNESKGEDKNESKDNSSKNNSSKNNNSKNNSSKNNASKNNSSKNNASKNNASKNNTSKNESKQEQPAIKDPDSLSLASLIAQMPGNLRGSTIHVFSWNPIKDVTGAEKVIADFTKKTGIKVKWEKGSYDTYDEAIIAKINSGSAPDVIRYNEPNPGRMATTQDLKTATGFDFKGDIWDKDVAEAFTVKGKTYGINLKTPLTNNQQLLCI